MTEVGRFIIPAKGGDVPQSIAAGQIIFLAGPNGVGKSSLIYAIYRQLKLGNVEILPGHRQVNFSSDDLDQVGQPLEDLARNRYQNEVHHSRFRNSWSEGHLKSILRHISDGENQANRDIRGFASASEQELKRFIQDHPSTIDQINSIFESGRLPVRIVMSDGVLKARRVEAGFVYNIDRMSDGERAALLLTGAVLTSPKNTVVAIDEPERHLHPGIAGHLIGALVRSRLDLGYIVSSHNLSLIEWLAPDIILHVRNSEVVTEQPEIRRYEVHFIKADDGVPDDVKLAVLGTRKALLFVEGDRNSHDQALYSLFNSEHHIVPRGGSEEVIQSVRGLAANGAYTWVSACGLIDGDGRGEVEAQTLAQDGIYCLSVPTIENLFFLPDVYRIMAGVIAQHEGGFAEQRITALEKSLLTLFAEQETAFVHRKVVWVTNRQLSAHKVSVKLLQQGLNHIEPVNLPLIIEQQKAEVSRIVAGGDFRVCIRQLPIKNSPIPSRIATALGYKSVSTYKNVALRQIEQKTEHGNKLFGIMRAEIPIVPSLTGEIAPAANDSHITET